MDVKNQWMYYIIKWQVYNQISKNQEDSNTVKIHCLIKTDYVTEELD